MSWTSEYEVGQEVKAYSQGAWRRGSVASRRKNSCMVCLGKYGTTNIHDPRNIRPWDLGKNKKSSSTSPENPSFDF